MKKLLYISCCVSIAALFVGCKPTEEGYKQAYEIAKAKRNAAEADPYTGNLMMREGDPEWRILGNDSVLYKRQTLKRLDGDTLPYKPYNIAVAQYKMKTNAVAHAERLSESGYKSRVFNNSYGFYITIVAQLDNVGQVVPFIKEYMKSNPNGVYPGFPNRPVLMIPTALPIRL